MAISPSFSGALALIVCTALAACGGAPSDGQSSSNGIDKTRKTGAKIVVDDVVINWNVAKGLKHSSGTDAALFMFFDAGAAKTTMKSSLSVSQRAALAERAVSAHPSCEWVGFDPAFHKSLEGNAGRPRSELWAPVKC